MKNLKMKKSKAVIAAVLIGIMALTGCSAAAGVTGGTTATAETTTASSAVKNSTGTEKTAETTTAEKAAETTTSGTVITNVSGGALETSDMFTDRDLEQTPDLTSAVTYTVKDGEDITITEAGVYVLTGSASNVTVYVDADDEAKVQIVLDGVTITNTDTPVIYVKNADKTFVTTTADSTLAVTGTFTADGDTNTDGVIFSKDDLVLNGTATLTINSSDNGVVSKDTLKVTGGTYVMKVSSKAMEANDEILIADGTFTITAGTDAIHAENDEDASLGHVYIAGGTFNLTAGDDAIHANSILQIDGGNFTIKAAEGLEATYVQINGGTISIEASDDGINAANKSNAYNVKLEINGGDITVVMGAGDTDGLDANGDIEINGGTLNVTANSPFDYTGSGVVNGGTVIVNGQQVTSLTNQMMGGGFGGNGMMGGETGGNGGFGGPGGNSGGFSGFGGNGGPRR